MQIFLGPPYLQYVILRTPKKSLRALLRRNVFYPDFHINDHFAVFSQPVGKAASDVVTVVKRNKILVGISRVNNVIILIP